MLVSPVLSAHLEKERVPFCLIGGVALATCGVARFTADVDLLTLDDRVLTPAFWAGSGFLAPVIARGDEADPLVGIARFALDPPHDLIVGKGAAATFALDTRRAHPSLPCPVASPLGLILLKLEAGGPQDAYDILALLNAAPQIGFPGLDSQIHGHLEGLSPMARSTWDKLEVLRKA